MKKDDKKEDKSKTIEEKAKEILKNNPIYMPDEPTTIGSPDNLFEPSESEENENK
ncbi:hypothetical protein [Agarilytica rhodophyticola]|uniref:hypothetical protein n=1 Tax=Agarilytica rhodophyticola TaxID=1737490 RepID=UPI001319D985|nr:hypothetical protein [Agarilytica rhodophyticola]